MDFLAPAQMPAPVAADDAATKAYVDDVTADLWTYQGEYDSGTAYARGDVVITALGKTYVATDDVAAGVSPLGEGVPWGLISERGTTGDTGPAGPSTLAAADVISWNADTNLYRAAADVLATDDELRFATRSAASTALSTRPSGSTVSRFTVGMDGKCSWSDGTNAADTNLYRSGADLLSTDDSLNIIRPTNGVALMARATGDTQSRFIMYAGGEQYWGTGAAAHDTNLYRGAANVLKTDDTMHAVLGVQAGNDAFERSWEIAFGSAANEKADIYFGGAIGALVASFEVTITSYHGGANANGTIKAIYSASTSTTAMSSTQHCSVVSVSGPISTQFALAPAITWDSTNSRARIQIAHLTTAANNVGVSVKCVTPVSTYATRIRDSIGVSAVYTTDATVFAANTETVDTLTFGGDVNLYRGSADRLQTDDHLQVAQTVRAMSGLQNGGFQFEKTFSISYTAVANQKADIYLAAASTAVIGVFEVAINSSWSTGDASGIIRAIYMFSGSSTGTITNSSMAIISTQGPITAHYALMPISWDATNLRWRIPIAKLITGTAGVVAASVRYITQNTSRLNEVRDGMAASALYTSDATVGPSNVRSGTATLVAGAATVAHTGVAAGSRIFLTSQADGGTPGFLRVSARTAGTSFTITSSSAADTSTVAWQMED